MAFETQTAPLDTKAPEAATHLDVQIYNEGHLGAALLLPLLLPVSASSSAAGSAVGAIAKPWWLAAQSLRPVAGLLDVLLLSGRDGCSGPSYSRRRADMHAYMATAP